ncbi:flagellar basal body L-ring protein FlgH [Bartonella sp. DGB2]|uniref:flagellar basal body L-ring protein FlgH n=1 Tax=Bartonella sp. DGB2 TaxID=3388426 RepID=UPI00398FA58D
MYKAFLCFAALVIVPSLVAGCSLNPKDFNRVPEFSPMRADLGYSSSANSDIYLKRPQESNYSLYRPQSQGFYRDPRAMKPGDILTVQIAINDRANLNNKTEVKKDGEAKYSLGASYSFIKGLSGSVEGDSKSQAKGDASVARQENISLSIAAVVTNVLPNGNLVINGSQEVRVNYELRVLNIGGIVRPRDISAYNTISYDKIAEARISYGGRGRMSEVQQSPYGQQLLNQFAPF